MTYVDGFLLPLPEKNIEAYREMAAKAGAVWMEHGALAYKECIADDVNPEWAKTKFPEIAKAGAGDTVIFAFIVYKSKEHRDEVNAKVMQDERIRETCPEHSDKPMPFDMARMAYGGFDVLVDL